MKVNLCFCEVIFPLDNLKMLCFTVKLILCASAGFLTKLHSSFHFFLKAI